MERVTSCNCFSGDRSSQTKYIKLDSNSMSLNRLAFTQNGYDYVRMTNCLLPNRQAAAGTKLKELSHASGPLEPHGPHGPRVPCANETTSETINRNQSPALREYTALSGLSLARGDG